MTFDNKVFLVHRMQSSFICNLWSWSNMYSGGSLKFLIDFLI